MEPVMSIFCVYGLFSPLVSVPSLPLVDDFSTDNRHIDLGFHDLILGQAEQVMVHNDDIRKVPDL